MWLDLLIVILALLPLLAPAPAAPTAGFR